MDFLLRKATILDWIELIFEEVPLRLSLFSKTLNFSQIALGNFCELLLIGLPFLLD